MCFKPLVKGEKPVSHRTRTMTFHLVRWNHSEWACSGVIAGNVPWVNEALEKSNVFPRSLFCEKFCWASWKRNVFVGWINRQKRFRWWCGTSTKMNQLKHFFFAAQSSATKRQSSHYTAVMTTFVRHCWFRMIDNLLQTNFLSLLKSLKTLETPPNSLIKVNLVVTGGFENKVMMRK